MSKATTTKAAAWAQEQGLVTYVIHHAGGQEMIVDGKELQYYTTQFPNWWVLKQVLM